MMPVSTATGPVSNCVAYAHTGHQGVGFDVLRDHQESLAPCGPLFDCDLWLDPSTGEILIPDLDDALETAIGNVVPNVRAALLQELVS